MVYVTTDHEPPDPRRMTSYVTPDPAWTADEIRASRISGAQAHITRVLDPMDPEARARVLRWVASRYGMKTPAEKDTEAGT